MNETIDEIINLLENAKFERELKKNGLLKLENGYYEYNGSENILVKTPQYGVFWFAYRLHFSSFIYEIGYGDRELLVESKIILPKFRNIQMNPILYLESINSNYIQFEPIYANNHTDSVLMQIRREIDFLVKNIEKFNSIDEVNIDDYQKLIRKKSIHDMAEQERKDMIYAISQAEVLFHAKDYEGFIKKIEIFMKREDIPNHIKLMFSYSKQRRS